jgi:formylglycine-generating enzyme required for sulfatase activity
MLVKMTLLIPFLACGALHALTISITGTVRDSVTGEPLAGAAIRVRDTAGSTVQYVIGTFSGPDGHFVRGIDVAAQPCTAIAAAQPRQPDVLADGTVRLSLPQAGGGEVAVYSPSGKLLRTAGGPWKQGENRVAFAPLPAGVYLYRIRVAEHVSTVKAHITRHCVFTRGSRGDSYARAGTLGKRAASSAVVAALVVGFPGYTTKRIPLTDTNARNLEVLLSPYKVNPWIPSESLVHDGAMVKIEAAGHSFQMGVDKYAFRCASPGHGFQKVSFTYDYWMDTAKVSRVDYTTIMRASYPGFKEPEWKDDRLSTRSASVSFGSAVLYCNARTRAGGSIDTVYRYDSLSGIPSDSTWLFGLQVDLGKSGFRLPTEAEWEYAARGGTPYEVFWGPFDRMDAPCWGNYFGWSGCRYVCSNKCDSVKAGVMLPNQYGLYCIIGSLEEWCNDKYADRLDGKHKIDPPGPDEGTDRVTRSSILGRDDGYRRAGFRACRRAD